MRCSPRLFIAKSFGRGAHAAGKQTANVNVDRSSSDCKEPEVSLTNLRPRQQRIRQWRVTALNSTSDVRLCSGSAEACACKQQPADG